MIEKAEHLFQMTFQYVQTWSRPSQDPMKRMFATRGASVACAVAETVLIVFKMMEGGNELGRRCLGFKKINNTSFSHEIRNRSGELGRLAVGLLGTVVLGVVFSPVANCRWHVRLQLIKDLAAEQTLRERQTKMQAEEKKRDLEQARATRFSQLEVKSTRSEVQEVEACLTRLLVS